MNKPESEDGFSRAIENMAEGDVFIVRLVGDTPEDRKYEIRVLTMEKLIRSFKKIGDGMMAGVTSSFIRPGTALYWVTLEHTWFSPTGPDEALYTCGWTRWQGQVWTMGFVPEPLAWTFDAAAQLTGMRVARGCPGIIDSDGFHEFPLPWVRNLENEDTAPIYQATEDALRLQSQGCVSPQEAIRRITTVERAMHRDEYEKIRKIYQAKGLDPDS